MKIFCVGRNYIDHAKELNNEVPTEPVIFIKPSTAIYNAEKPFNYPSFTNELHYEAEIVLRVCKTGNNISEDQAPYFYDAFTVGIDFTARDLQANLKKKGLPWEKAKAFDNSAIIGKWIENNPLKLKAPYNFSMKLNGNIVQKATSNEMIFSFNQIISDISKFFTIEDGDYIFTGTPAGVGPCIISDILEGYFEYYKVFEIQIK